jgi:DNA-directed RNA polymerase specialized sigma24 family protein
MYVAAPNPQAPTFAELLGRARAGSGEAKGMLLKAQEDYLLTQARGSLPGDLQAKMSDADVVQDTFVRAIEHFASFEGDSESTFRSWLHAVFRTVHLNTQHAYRDAKSRQVDREVSFDPDSPGHPASQVAARLLGPCEALMQKELAAGVRPKGAADALRR